MIIEPEAREELFAAAAWYDDQRAGLSDEFLEAIDEVLGRVTEAPLSFPRDRFDERARRALVARFPFAVVFVVHGDEVRVVAFVHAKRLPDLLDQAGVAPAVALPPPSRSWPQPCAPLQLRCKNSTEDSWPPDRPAVFPGHSH